MTTPEQVLANNQSGENLALPKEDPMYLKDLQLEVRGLGQREVDYFETARRVDRVVIMGGCDDSRQGIPEGIQEIEWQGEKLHVLFAFVSTIGGGVSTKTLPMVVNQFIEQGVDKEKIVVIVTQHGNSEEVNAAKEGTAVEKKTCGLRDVLERIQKGEQVHLAEGLLEHAGTINQSPDIMENLEYVYDQTCNLLTDTGIRGVYGALFDHEGSDEDGKSMDVVLGVTNLVAIPIKLAAWHEKHQDPQALVVSVGKRASSIPDGVILPTTVGRDANNDFNSAGVDKESFFNAMNEQWYALSHVGGHGEDQNFKNTKMMLLLCDGEEQINWVKEFMESAEFRNDFVPHIKKLPNQGLYVVDLNKEEVSFRAVM